MSLSSAIGSGLKLGASLAPSFMGGGGITGTDILNFGASLYDSNTALKNAKHQMGQNKEFAQKGIRWKVADAKAAGIHPLYAMGASTNMPSVSMQGGSNISGALKSAMDGRLTRLQEKAIQADIVLKLARASEVSRRGQRINSQQDKDVLDPQELVPATVKVSERHGVEHGKGGRIVKSQLGNFLFKSNQPSAQSYEDETGEAVSMLASTMESAKAWGRWKHFKNEARKRYPINYRKTPTKQELIKRRIQQRRQAQWLQHRVKIFLKHGD